MIAFALPALAASERAALVEFNNGGKRSDGTVAWRTEQVKTPSLHGLSLPATGLPDIRLSSTFQCDRLLVMRAVAMPLHEVAAQNWTSSITARREIQAGIESPAVASLT